MPHLSLVFFAAAILLWAGPSPCDAQASKASQSQEPVGYREAINTALEEVQLGNFAEARAQFARAHALFPNARTLRGLGISEFELKHYLTAADYLSQALNSEVRPLDGSLRRDTDALLTRAKTYVGELRIIVSPTHAAVVIDGTLKLDAGTPVQLDVGDHVLEVRAQGYASERRQVTVRGGQVERVEVQLAALATAATAQAEPTPPNTAPPAGEASRSERVPVYKRWWLWTVVGVVVASAAAGTVIALKADKAPAEYQGVASENTPSGAGLQPLWRY